MSQSNNPYSSNLGGTQYPNAMSQPHVQYPVADLGKRFLGALIDGFSGLVAVGPGYVLMIVGAASMEPNGQQQPTELPVVALLGMGLVVVGMIALLALQIYLLATRSQSLGKYVMKTQMIDVRTGQPAGFVSTFLLRILVNGIICGIPCLGSIYALVDICWIFGEERRCIHDLLASTTVVDISGA